MEAGHLFFNQMKTPIKLDHANGGPLSRMTKAERKILTRVLLPQIQEAYEMYRQWIVDENLVNAAKYHAQMETLIEVLEVANCGSTGGFDAEQPESQTVTQRFEWLKTRALREFNFEVVVHPHD